MSAVTLVITSCGRDDLLAATLRSFAEHNSAPIARVILTEDSGREGWQPPALDAIAEISKDLVVIAPPYRAGQIASIDRAYARVETPYIMHCEDDWRFYRANFIERSMAVLKYDPRVCMVWIREPNDRMGHPTTPGIKRTPDGTAYQYMRTGYARIWHGFSFNPGLRRLADYHKVGPYERHTGKSIPGHTPGHEAIITSLYRRQNMVAATLTEGYVEHTGWNQTVNA